MGGEGIYYRGWGWGGGAGGVELRNKGGSL